MMFMGFTTWHIPIDWICQQRNEEINNKNKTKAHWSTANQKLIPIMRQILKTNTHREIFQMASKNQARLSFIRWFASDENICGIQSKISTKNNAKLIRTFVVSIIFGVCWANKVNRWGQRGDFFDKPTSILPQSFSFVRLYCLLLSGQRFSRSLQIFYLFALLTLFVVTKSRATWTCILYKATWKSS